MPVVTEPIPNDPGVSMFQVTVSVPGGGTGRRGAWEKGRRGGSVRVAVSVGETGPRIVLRA